MVNDIMTSIGKAAEILKCLGTNTNSVTGISRKTSLNKSTVHKLLSSLVQLWLAEYDPTNHKYYMGHLIMSLAFTSNASYQKLGLLAYEEMLRLRDISGESVVMFVRVGTQRRIIEEVVSNQNLKFVLGKGYTAPLHTGSSGKILLAELSDEELHIILNNMSLTQEGPNAITDLSVLRQEIERVRKQGYAVGVREQNTWGAGLSVPIKNFECPVSLSMHGPAERFADTMLDYLQELKASAVIISRKLGCLASNHDSGKAHHLSRAGG